MEREDYRVGCLRIKHPGPHCRSEGSHHGFFCSRSREHAHGTLQHQEQGRKPLYMQHWPVAGPHLAKAACNSSSFLASCILSSAICAWSSAIWSLRSVESPSSLRRVFSSSCRCFSSLRRRSDREGRRRD